jgi:hypothetical protein
MTAPCAACSCRARHRRRLGGAGWRVPDAAALARQHEAFCALLADLGAQVEVAPALDGPGRRRLHARPAADDRARRHPAADAQAGAGARAGPRAEELERLGVPVLGELPEGAYADGGDRFWLDDRTMAIGLGYRTNRAGAARCGARRAEGVAVEAYDLPHDRGRRTSCTCSRSSRRHRRSCAWSTSRSRPCGCSTTCASAASAGSRSARTTTTPWGCNVLAVRPGSSVVVDGVPAVRRALDRAGVEVHAYDGSELSLRRRRPTCLTAPLLRG